MLHILDVFVNQKDQLKNIDCRKEFDEDESVYKARLLLQNLGRQASDS